MRKVEINGKTYSLAPMNFNTICAIDELGISIDDYTKKQMAFVRAYLAVSTGLTTITVGEELESHIIGGGDFKEIFKAVGEEIDESDFFQAIKKKQETKNGKSEKKTEEKK